MRVENPPCHHGCSLTRVTPLPSPSHPWRGKWCALLGVGDCRQVRMGATNSLTRIKLLLGDFTDQDTIHIGNWDSWNELNQKGESIGPPWVSPKQPHACITARTEGRLGQGRLQDPPARTGIRSTLGRAKPLHQLTYTKAGAGGRPSWAGLQNPLERAGTGGRPGQARPG